MCLSSGCTLISSKVAGEEQELTSYGLYVSYHLPTSRLLLTSIQVMSFGAPAGGVLCMELLYPTLPNRPIPYINATSPRITRSSIIQQLSLLVGFLGWVGPSAPNREHTANCKRVIQSVLDYTLNASTVPLGPGQHVMDGMGMPFEVGGLDLGFDRWGTFDWFRTEDGMPGFN
jgi:hypothetical protein